MGAGIGLPCFLPGPLAPFLSPSRYSLSAGLASGFVLSSRTDRICVSGPAGKPDKQVQIFDFFFKAIILFYFMVEGVARAEGRSEGMGNEWDGDV